MTAITGQSPIVTKAKKSIAAFKLREGMNIGAKVTLRGERMYVFRRQAIQHRAAAHPRLPRAARRKLVRRARKLQLGLKEQLVFPEINYDKVDKTRGMDIAIVTTAKTDEEATEFLVAMGLPLQKGRERRGCKWLRRV